MTAPVELIVSPADTDKRIYYRAANGCICYIEQQLDRPIQHEDKPYRGYVYADNDLWFGTFWDSKGKSLSRPDGSSGLNIVGLWENNDDTD